MKKIYLSFAIVAGASIVLLYSLLSPNKVEKNHTLSQVEDDVYDKDITILKERYARFEKMSTRDVKDIPKKDRPDLAARHEMLKTMDPSLGFPPSERRFRAYKTAMKMLRSKGRKAIDNVEWTERGPDNIAGRTRALMFDPNDPNHQKVWAGGVTGGLWYNDNISDPSTTWKKIDDMMANLSIGSITHDPNATRTFYMGTGNAITFGVRGAGLWKSTDAGDNWEQIPSTDNSDFFFVQKIVVTESSTVLAGTREGLFRSTNGGDSWEKVMEEAISDIELTGGILYVGTYKGKAMKSTNDGIDFDDITPALNGERVELGTTPSNPSLVYAIAEKDLNVGWFRKSEDGGANWVDVTIPRNIGFNCQEVVDVDFTRNQAWYNLILAIDPNNTDMVIAGGINLHRSMNGGQDWENISFWIDGACDSYVHADQHAIEYNPANDRQVIFGTDGGVALTEDITAIDPVINHRNRGYNVTQFYAVATTNESASNNFLAGAQDNGTQRFVSAGLNSTTEANGGDGAFCFIDQDDPTLQIASFVFNTYVLSTNGGLAFSYIGVGESAGRFTNPADYDDKTNILYAAHDVGKYVSYTIGETGNVTHQIDSIGLNKNIASSIKVSPYTDNRIFIASAARSIFSSEQASALYMVDNANTKPVEKRIDGEKLPKGFISSIDIGKDDDHLLVTLSNYGIASVWETTDGGTTWNNKEGNLPDMPVRWGIYNPKNPRQVLLATEVGVWSTDNIGTGSPVWEPTNAGLANVRCDMLQYRASDGLVTVATFGRGVFTTDVFSPDISAQFSQDQNISYIGKPIQFTNRSIGKVDLRDYLWNFGDGTTSTEQNPLHTYTDAGTYTVSLTINGSSVEEKTESVHILPNRGDTYLSADGGDFESNTLDFATERISGTEFKLGKSSITGKEGTTSGERAWVSGITGDYTNLSFASLYTPEFDFSKKSSYTLSFNINHKIESEGPDKARDGCIVEYSTDQGETWFKIGNQVEDGWYNQTTIVNNVVFEPGEGVFSGSSNGFKKKTRDLTFLQGNEKVALRFSFRSDGGTIDAGLAIDDFEIISTIVDFQSDVTTTECPRDTVTFSENIVGNLLDTYEWDFGEGAIPATATTPGPHKVVYTKGGTKTISLNINGDFPLSKTDFITVGEGPDEVATISQDINTFILSTDAVGTGYQWFRNNIAITQNGTGPTLDPISSGEYVLRIDQTDGCPLYSEPFTTGIVGLDKATFESSFSIYPNPSRDFIAIESDISFKKRTQVMVYNLLGEVVFNKSYPTLGKGQKIVLDLQQHARGTYLIDIFTDEYNLLRKIQKID